MEVQPSSLLSGAFLPYRDTSLHYLSNLHNSDFGFDASSDLTPGVNEGGLKVWECSYDLIQYLRLHPQIVTGKRVLELGCGHGLPGIACKQLGAREVVFQDYTSAVLERVTAANILKNLGSTEGTRLISGPWGDYTHLGRFDLIISSETTYNPAGYPGLLAAIGSCIAETCLIACKTYYFGVGGGTEAFLQAAQAAGFPTNVVTHYQDGRSSLRDLIAISPNT